MTIEQESALRDFFLGFIKMHVLHHAGEANSRTMAKSPNSSGLFGVMLARSETHSRTSRDSEHIPITSSNPNESAPRKATLYTIGTLAVPKRSGYAAQYLR